MGLHPGSDLRRSAARPHEIEQLVALPQAQGQDLCEASPPSACGLSHPQCTCTGKWPLSSTMHLYRQNFATTHGLGFPNIAEAMPVGAALSSVWVQSLEAWLTFSTTVDGCMHGSRAPISCNKYTQGQLESQLDDQV